MSRWLVYEIEGQLQVDIVNAMIATSKDVGAHQPGAIEVAPGDIADLQKRAPVETAARATAPNSSDEYLSWQSAIESAARTYPRKLPIVLKSGRGVYVTDIEGREYIDCLAGAGALALGHNHPVVTEAIQRALEQGVVLQTLDLPTPLKHLFVESLYDSLPPIFAREFKIHFCGPSGADAVEAALKLVRTATGRQQIFSFRGAYHGMTAGALSATGETGPKASIGGISPGVQFLPFPSNRHCPFGLGGAAGAEMCARYVDELLSDANSGLLPPAGIILEVVQGEGGVNPAPSDWLRRLREIADRHSAPLIFDEVQTGAGRTGAFYAFEQAGVLPDVLVLSKAIGGGLPLAVMLYRRSLDRWKPGAHAGTFRGNQLAFATGAATLDFVRAERLYRNAGEMGRRFQDALWACATNSRSIAEVRGRGLMIGVEIASPAAGGPEATYALARRIQDECRLRGLIVELGGRNGAVVRFLPPLILSEQEVGAIVDRFDAAVKAAETATL